MDERCILKAESEITIKGKSLGVFDMFLRLLCGDEEEASPTEQAVLLTEEFFDEGASLLAYNIAWLCRTQGTD